LPSALLLERFADPQDLFGLERGGSIDCRGDGRLAAGGKCVGSR
jgi:hypothetical protein